MTRSFHGFNLPLTGSLAVISVNFNATISNMGIIRSLIDVYPTKLYNYSDFMWNYASQKLVQLDAITAN